MAMSNNTNKEWDKMMSTETVFFFYTQLSHAMKISVAGGKPYAMGWWRPSDNVTHVEYSDVAPTYGEVEATYVA